MINQYKPPISIDGWNPKHKNGKFLGMVDPLVSPTFQGYVSNRFSTVMWNRNMAPQIRTFANRWCMPEKMGTNGVCVCKYVYSLWQTTNKHWGDMIKLYSNSWSLRVKPACTSSRWFCHEVPWIWVTVFNAATSLVLCDQQVIFRVIDHEKTNICPLGF